MSNKVKEILDSVKAKFNELLAAPVIGAAPVAPVVATATPVVYKTTDGVEISITQAGEKPAPADIVTIEGQPAAAADYTLEDGTVVTVGEGGVIASVIVPEPVTQPEEPAMDMAALTAKVAALEAEVTKLRQPATAMSAEVTEKFTAHENIINGYKETISGLFELVEAMSKEPSTEPATLTGLKKEKFEKSQEKNARIEARAKAIADLKKKSKNPVTA